MIHYNIETVCKEAEEMWELNNRGKSPDNTGKYAFMFGCLKVRYKYMYHDLPAKFKEKQFANKYNSEIKNTEL